MGSIARLLALAALLAPAHAAADVIVLRADPWCPYNCEPGSDRPGYMVELAREALEPYGHEVRYQTVNWSRGLKQAADGVIDGVIGAVPEEAPDFVFGPPMGRWSDALVFRRGEARPVAEVADLDGLRLGAIQDYDHWSVIDGYIAANGHDGALVQYATGDRPIVTNLRKLLAGRIDVTTETAAVLDYTVHELGIAGEVEIVDELYGGDIFIAFSPVLETSALYARQLTEGIARLRRNGRYDAILARYGLN